VTASEAGRAPAGPGAARPGPLGSRSQAEPPGEVADGLAGRHLTEDEFDHLLPEKPEYHGDHQGTGGKRCGARGGPALLALLLCTFGLREAVRFAPEALWRQAFDGLPPDEAPPGVDD
jgi:hypothetical protein